MKKLLLFLALVGLASAQITTTGSALVPGSVTPASSGGSGTVTSVSVTTANGVSGSVATATTTPAITLTLGDITPSTITVSGISSFTGASIEPPNAMAALAIDVTKRKNTKTIAADSVFTFSGTPGTSGQVFSMLVTNSDSAQHALTIPSSFAVGIGTITTTIIPASGKLRLTWQYDGSAYDLYGASPLVTGTGNYVLATSPTITTPVISGHATIEGVTPTGATGTGNLVFSADPIFTSSLQLPNAASPTTDAFGELAGDNNAWAASRGALQFFDGTANTFVVGVLASDTPSNAQVPTWNTGGTITWETPAGGAALTSTQVGYGDGSNLLTGEAAFTYNATTNTLTSDNVSAPTGFAAGNLRMNASGTVVTTTSGDLNFTSASGDIVIATGTRTILTGTAQFFPRGGLKRVGTQFDKTSSTVLSDVTGLSVSLAASTSYRFRAVLFTTSNIASGVQAAIASSGSITSIIYEGYNTSAGSIAQTRATTSGASVAAVTAVTAATIIIEGSITTNAAGSLTVQFAQNTSNGAASSVLVGSYIEVFGF